MKQIFPFTKDAKLFRWGPIPGRYFYVSEIDDIMFKEYPKFYQGERWPTSVFLFKDERMVLINDLNELEDTGKKVFLHYAFSKTSRDKLKKQWQKKIKELSDFEKKIDDSYLEDLTDQEVYDLWYKFYGLIVAFWLPTVPVEISNYGSAKLLEEKLRKYIKDDKELYSVTEILTAQENPSFYQKEEIDLVKTKDLVKHTKKYFWLRNSYNGVEELSVDYFDKRKKDLQADIKNLIEERLSGLKKKKRKIIQKYQFSKEIKDIVKAICEGVEWQEERKKYIYIYLHYKELFLKEVVKRSKYNIDSLRNCSSIEIMQILLKRGVHALIDNRTNMFGFLMDTVTEELTGEEAEFCWENYSADKIEVARGGDGLVSQTENTELL